MIKKLKIKFILISTLITTVVLFSIIGIINYHNYSNVKKNADMVLNILSDNNGEFPKPDDLPNNDDNNLPPQSGPKDDRGDGSLEMPYENRYFVVTISNDRQILECKIDKIASVNEQEASEIALLIDSKDSIKGYYKNFRYRVIEKDENKMLIFLDCQRQLNTYNDFLKNSLRISLIGLSIVFVLIVIFSNFVIKPVEESYKKQKRFITDASHELKTPLTTINACCDILEYTVHDNEWLETIKEQTNKLSELTNKLVFLARIDENSKKVIMSDFSLTEVAEDVSKTYKKIAEEKFITNIESNITCSGDVSLVRELLTQLFDNAIKYAKSKIVFKVEKEKIVLTNDADELPSGNLNILFERFYRLDKSRNNSTGGHGVGLSVCKAICDLHKWKITASSNGKEIKFEINF